MSGICGILNFDKKPVDLSLLRHMTNQLKYRGPDKQNIWVNGHIGFGHTLFRTTFESANEHQPLTLNSKIYITANARIDDRNNLISLLKSKGCQLTNEVPDVELILHSYQLWGKDCITHLMGDFVFVIWDEEKKQLFCARDHFGLRVLYYTILGKTFVFSNSLKCVQSYPGVSNRLNEQAIGDFLLFGSHTWLDKSTTTFLDIHKVPPAHTLTFNNQNLKIKKYWNIPLDTPFLYYRKEEDYLEHFRNILKTSVKERMRTDRIVISMSGGIDSTSIAATACEIARKQSHSTKINAFTAVYDRIHPDQERYYSGLVANKLRLPIQYFVSDDYQLLNPIITSSEPNEGLTPARNLDMQRQIATLGRVVFSGRSTDNLIRPSSMTLVRMLEDVNPILAILEYIRLWRNYGKRLPLGTGILNQFKSKNISNKMNLSYGYPCWLNSDFEARQNLKERWKELLVWQPSKLHPRHPEAHKLLVFPDWTFSSEYIPGMNFSPSEYVDPYMDLRLVKFILSLPPWPWCFDKYLVRKAMQDKLPLEVLKRPKTVLGPLHDSLLRLSSSDWVDSWKPTSQLSHYVNQEAIPAIAKGVCNYRESYVNLRPLHLNIWLRDYFGCVAKSLKGKISL